MKMNNLIKTLFSFAVLSCLTPIHADSVKEKKHEELIGLSKAATAKVEIKEEPKVAVKVESPKIAVKEDLKVAVKVETPKVEAKEEAKLVAKVETKETVKVESSKVAVKTEPEVAVKVEAPKVAIKEEPEVAVKVETSKVEAKEAPKVAVKVEAKEAVKVEAPKVAIKEEPEIAVKVETSKVETKVETKETVKVESSKVAVKEESPKVELEDELKITSKEIGIQLPALPAKEAPKEELTSVFSEIKEVLADSEDDQPDEVVPVSSEMPFGESKNVIFTLPAGFKGNRIASSELDDCEFEFVYDKKFGDNLEERISIGVEDVFGISARTILGGIADIYAQLTGEELKAKFIKAGALSTGTYFLELNPKNANTILDFDDIHQNSSILLVGKIASTSKERCCFNAVYAKFFDEGALTEKEKKEWFEKAEAVVDSFILVDVKK